MTERTTRRGGWRRLRGVLLAASIAAQAAASARAGEAAAAPPIRPRPPVLAPELVAVPGGKFAIGRYEVTQAEWRAVMGGNPSRFSACEQCPVEQVSWNDVQGFLEKLNALTGEDYRLPTDAEWNTACQAGGRHELFCGGNDLPSLAWHRGNSEQRTHPVGEKRANAWGIHDMSGNVWEWVENCHDDDCSRGVVRGGAWSDALYNMRWIERLSGSADNRVDFVGFRLARTLP